MPPYELAPSPCAVILERTRAAYEAAIRLEHMTRRGAVPLDASNGQIVDDLMRAIEGAARLMPQVTREAGLRRIKAEDFRGVSYQAPIDIEVMGHDTVRIEGRDYHVLGTIGDTVRRAAPRLSVVGDDGPGAA